MCRRDRPAIAPVVWLLLFLPFAAAGQGSGQSDRLASQLESLNGELSANASLVADPRLLGHLLAARASVLSELIAENPAKALDLALSTEIAAQLRRVAPDASIEARGEWEGTLEAIVADDFEHHRSSTRWYLHTADGKLEVYFAEPATRRPGVSVRVGGIQVAGRIAAAHVVSAAASLAAAAQQCTTIGPQNIAVLMVTTPSNRTFPSGFTAASLRQAFFGSAWDVHSTDSVNGMWKEMSYGQASATGQVFGPFALSQDYTCDQASDLGVAAIRAADATVDFTQFTRVAVVFPAASCSYGGLSTVGCLGPPLASPSKGDLTASTAYFPVRPNDQAPNVGVYAHELGHSLGLGHSNSQDYNHIPLGPLNTAGLDTDYGDPFSIMGYSLRGQYPAQFKSHFLHWLNPGDYQEVQSSGSFALAPFEASAGVRALRVLRDADSNSWLWIEYRQRVGDIDGLLPYSPQSNVTDGALIHYEYPTLPSMYSREAAAQVPRRLIQ